MSGNPKLRIYGERIRVGTCQCPPAFSTDLLFNKLSLAPYYT